ncbi:MAG: magnesium transporter [Planctomycetota bacterium]
MINTLYLPELREMLATGDADGLREFCQALHPARVAEFMEGLDAGEAWRVLEASPQEQRVAVFGFLAEDVQVGILESVDPADTSQLVADMPADDRVDLLSEVSQDVAGQVLPLLPHADRRETMRLLEFPEGTAGSKMTTEVARLSASLTVHQALEAISRQAEDSETVYYNYVVDEDDHLLGLVSARQLVTHFGSPDKPIADLMQRDVVCVLATDDQEVVADKVAEYDFLAIPVVDDHRRLLGIITHDDVLDVMREEATEDAHLGAAIDPLDDSYLVTHWATLAWKRGVWLGVLFIAALLTALSLRYFEAGFQLVPWLVLFVPLVISSGGNSGSQSATLVITGLTNGDVTVGDWWRVMRRELLMGLCLGSVLAVTGYVCAYALTRPTGAVAAPAQAEANAPAEQPAPPTAGQLLVLPITLLMVVICGTLCGGTLPLLFERLGFDPALMSTPFVAGIIDIVGIVVYMKVALAIVGY